MAGRDPRTRRRARDARSPRAGAAGSAIATTPAPAPPTGDAGGWLATSLILATPLLVVALFWYFGASPVQPQWSAPAHVQGPAKASQPERARAGGDRAAMADAQIEQLAAQLAARLEREPGDADGWRTLARTYYVMKRFPEAVGAYGKLVALAPLDADILADYADALAMTQGRSLAGKPMELVRKALELDPAQWKALSMAATDAFQRNDVQAAIGFWERALAAVPPDSSMAESIRGSLAQARQPDAAPVVRPSASRSP